MKERYRITLLLAIVAGTLYITALPCWAVEKEQEDIWAEDTPRWEHGRYKLSEEKIERIMNRLKETNPEKAQELVQLRKKDPEKFDAELRKAIRELSGKKMKERMKQGPGDVPAGRGMHPMGPMHGGSGVSHDGPGMEMMREHLWKKHAEYIEWLEKNYPEDANELAELKEKDPPLYMRQMGLSLRKYRRIFEASKDNPELANVLKENMELTKKQHELVKEIKAAKDAETKKELTKELEVVVGKKFDLIVKRKQIAYEQMLKRLEELKKEVKDREAEVVKWKEAKFKNESVKARVEELVSGAEKFKWE